MTYEEIIKKAGKQLQKDVYYYDDNNTMQTISSEDFIHAKISFNADLVGSVMKGLELQLKVTLPLKPIYMNVTAKYGTYTAKKLYGPFNIKGDPEYNADNKSYTYKLYDEFLNTMKDYKSITITYPCTVIDFFLQLVSELNLTTSITSLPNGTKTIESDIYDDINFTYRDVIDDIGKATATLFEVAGTELKKCSLGTSTNQATIDDDILKNCNISFGQHFGPINTVILSRSADSDYIYLSDEGVAEEDRKAFKIEDCQIMNENNRSEYLSELLTSLSGIEYDIFDTELVGYGGFVPLQKIVFETGNNSYISYVFNNEILFSSGYSESVYTDMPGESDEDYKASDTTDKKINQTYIICRKQEQKIEAITKQVNSVNDKVNENYYTKEESNQLIQTATEGLTNIFSNTGGQNIWRNTNLFEEKNDGHAFWTGFVVKESINDTSRIAMKLQNGSLYQSQSITNGIYTNSFKYKKLISTANCTVKYNGHEIELGEEGTITTTGEINTNAISIEFLCDTDNGYIVWNLMLNRGEKPISWEQNANETISDTVKIGLGVEVRSSSANTYSRMDADGNRVYNATSNEKVREDTDKGTYVKYIECESAKISNLSVTKTSNNHTFISGL